MVPLLVFYVHIVAAAAAFTKRYQEDGPKEGALVVFFMALIFFVGWSITSLLLQLVMDQEGFGPWLDRDAASLLLLTMLEGVFYYLYLKDDGGLKEGSTATGKEVPPGEVTSGQN